MKWLQNENVGWTCVYARVVHERKMSESFPYKQLLHPKYQFPSKV